ncbi:hypothetical protein WICPIJ_006132 [Wickerhamomyces pijperi]|uniref:Secreted protein n=1 Tax=Wickerhamomyces pijperi TaxID=599730 RepID=A0A9P8Q4U9_WICPI|nr:hypothetical protein WICPIJ_006132 [Wickerhamomyces pijperi]
MLVALWIKAFSLAFSILEASNCALSSSTANRDSSKLCAILILSVSMASFFSVVSFGKSGCPLSNMSSWESRSELSATVASEWQMSKSCESQTGGRRVKASRMVLSCCSSVSFPSFREMVDIPSSSKLQAALSGLFLLEKAVVGSYWLWKAKSGVLLSGPDGWVSSSPKVAENKGEIIDSALEMVSILSELTEATSAVASLRLSSSFATATVFRIGEEGGGFGGFSLSLRCDFLKKLKREECLCSV